MLLCYVSMLLVISSKSQASHFRKTYQLRVRLVDLTDVKGQAAYSSFKLADTVRTTISLKKIFH